MSHGPEHQIEHAEHAVHAAHDDFNRPVTMSIAIVAALLACFSMLGHRAHNETLRLQGEALSLQTEAANKWAYYQSKNIFNLESEITLDLLSVLTTREDRKKELETLVRRYSDNVKKYKGDSTSESEDTAAKGKLAKIMQEADLLSKLAQDRLQESHLMHAKGERFDYGELGLQFGVVLCSLAILTKGRVFWFAGLLSSAVGVAIAMTGQFGLLLSGHH